MATLPEAQFDELVVNLGKFLVQSASAFLLQRGHSGIDCSQLHQLSPPLSEMATQLLMHGADIWPDLEPCIPIRGLRLATG